MAHECSTTDHDIVTGAKIVWEIYHQGADTTTTAEAPCYLAPVCPCCGGPSFHPPCERCGTQLCHACRAVFWWCGTLPCHKCSAQRNQFCGVCGCTMCDECSTSHVVSLPTSNSDDHQDSPRESSSSEGTGTLVTGSSSSESAGTLDAGYSSTGGSGALVAGTGGTYPRSQHHASQFQWPQSHLHQWLQEHWPGATSVVLKLGRIWLSLGRLPELGGAIVDDGIAVREFGSCAGHYRRLAEELVHHDLPWGIVVFNVDRETIMVFVAGRKPNPAAVTSALSWMQRFQALGLVMRSCRGGLEFSLVDATQAPGYARPASRYRAALVEIVASWGGGQLM